MKCVKAQGSPYSFLEFGYWLRENISISTHPHTHTPTRIYTYTYEHLQCKIVSRCVFIWQHELTPSTFLIHNSNGVLECRSIHCDSPAQM